MGLWFDGTGQGHAGDTADQPVRLSVAAANLPEHHAFKSLCYRNAHDGRAGRAERKSAGCEMRLSG